MKNFPQKGEGWQKGGSPEKRGRDRTFLLQKFQISLSADGFMTRDTFSHALFYKGGRYNKGGMI